LHRRKEIREDFPFDSMRPTASFSSDDESSSLSVHSSKDIYSSLNESDDAQGQGALRIDASCTVGSSKNAERMLEIKHQREVEDLKRRHDQVVETLKSRLKDTESALHEEMQRALATRGQRMEINAVRNVAKEFARHQRMLEDRLEVLQIALEKERRRNKKLYTSGNSDGAKAWLQSNNDSSKKVKKTILEELERVSLVAEDQHNTLLHVRQRLLEALGPSQRVFENDDVSVVLDRVIDCINECKAGIDERKCLEMSLLQHKEELAALEARLNVQSNAPPPESEQQQDEKAVAMLEARLLAQEDRVIELRKAAAAALGRVSSMQHCLVTLSRDAVEFLNRLVESKSNFEQTYQDKVPNLTVHHLSSQLLQSLESCTSNFQESAAKDKVHNTNVFALDNNYDGAWYEPFKLGFQGLLNILSRLIQERDRIIAVMLLWAATDEEEDEHCELGSPDATLGMPVEELMYTLYSRFSKVLEDAQRDKSCTEKAYQSVKKEVEELQLYARSLEGVLTEMATPRQVINSDDQQQDFALVQLAKARKRIVELEKERPDVSAVLEDFAQLGVLVGQAEESLQREQTDLLLEVDALRQELADTTATTRQFKNEAQESSEKIRLLLQELEKAHQLLEDRFSSIQDSHCYNVDRQHQFLRHVLTKGSSETEGNAEPMGNGMEKAIWIDNDLFHDAQNNTSDKDANLTCHPLDQYPSRASMAKAEDGETDLHSRCLKIAEPDPELGIECATRAKLREPSLQQRLSLAYHHINVLQALNANLEKQLAFCMEQQVKEKNGSPWRHHQPLGTGDAASMEELKTAKILKNETRELERTFKDAKDLLSYTNICLRQIDVEQISQLERVAQRLEDIAVRALKWLDECLNAGVSAFQDFRQLPSAASICDKSMSTICRRQIGSLQSQLAEGFWSNHEKSSN
jgi:hypothetical protein